MEGKSTHIVTRLLVLLLPILLAAFQLWHPDSDLVGMREGSSWQHLTYHFFHANWFHLCLNWWCMTGLLLSYNYTVLKLLWCFVIASLYPFAGITPIIGLSGIIFAMCGIATRNMRTVSVVLASIALTYLMPNMAVGLHLWCYVIGLVSSLVYGIQRKA